MAVLDQAESARLLNYSWNGTAPATPTTPIKLGLFTALGTATTAGTEVVNSGSPVSTYARQAIAMTVSGTSCSNTATLTYANMPPVTTAAIESYDSAATPVRKWFGPLQTPRTTALGDALQFTTGSVVASDL